MVVDAAQSHRFFDEIFGGLHNRSNMRSVVWDSLWCVRKRLRHFILETEFTKTGSGQTHEKVETKRFCRVDFVHVASHITVAGRQQLWMSGFADTAAKYRLPIRLDQAYASDFVVGAAFPALVTARVGGDGDGKGASGGSWTNMGAAAPLLASLHVRPMMDVIRSAHPTALHQLVVAVLTTGPVGIGDELGRTDLDMLMPALRNDSTVLKPAHPAIVELN